MTLSGYSTLWSLGRGSRHEISPDNLPIKPIVRNVGDPRTDRMPVDQDWTAVYPAAAPFRQGSVPLPVRMGFPVKRGVPPEKKGNLELIKIPNFLHLTPISTVKKHLDIISHFLGLWPSALDTDAKYDEHFPVKVKSKDYVSAGTSLRNPSARIVHLRVSVCLPNYDYAMYLLTKVEALESEKTVADMEYSPSQKNALSTLVLMRVAGEGEAVREELLGKPEVQEYRDSVTRLKNERESEGSVLQYREAVTKLLNL
uniref:Mitochondrial ribosomal protein S35 n=1 Tax=Hucho hucho TaxID=62062 RepID=A0A4W5MRD9_9TELE